MIIDAQKRFLPRGIDTWFRKFSSSRGQPCKVMPLRDEPEVSAEQDPASPLAVFSEAEEMLLRNSTRLLATNGHEIANHFYKKIVHFMLWNRDSCKKLIVKESERLVPVLIDYAQHPTKSASLAFLLADTWVTYRFKGDLGEPYDTVTRFLAEVLEGVLWKQLSPEARDAWNKALDPHHVFGTGLGFSVTPISEDPRFSRNH